MLKLKRVEVQGFKSFYDRTDMKFSGTGIAAIVGPNGCGKSNLSDAISWVLGEQSAKTLRGARMEDVIFAGTRDRKPLGMASVTMTLVPEELPDSLITAPRISLEEQIHANGHAIQSPIRTEAGHAAGRTGEITITRRLYRSGESEYLMNGKLARLRDIQDLFLGTGLGPESYAIIEQGRIGQILSNRPQDRRNIIEEAAGITKFKTRKRLAESKLESAKQNLARVFDILEEVTRQVNSLKRQAAKTKRYSELKQEATAYLRQVLAAKFRMLERDTAKLVIELNLASVELQRLQAEIERGETLQSEVTEASYASDRDLTEARKSVSDLRLEAERARGRLEYQTRQIEQIQLHLTRSEHEMQALNERSQETTAELEKQTAELSSLEAQCERERQLLDAKAAERYEMQSRFSEGERAQETARQNLRHLFNEASTLKNQIIHAEAQIGAAEREMTRTRLEEQQCIADLDRIQHSSTELSVRMAARQAELDIVTNHRKNLEGHLQSKRAEMSESGQALERLRTEFSRVKARRDSLEEVLEHRSYTTETVKRFFKAVERGDTRDLQPIGVLADFVEVDPQLEKAAEEFLHEELEYVVVRDWAEAERGIEVMRADLNGRATFLVEATNEASVNPDELPQPEREAGIVTRLTGVVRLTNGFSSAPLSLLPRIANCYVVIDRGVAQRLAAEYPHCWFLVTDGVSYHGQAVSGGKKTGAGPLALKRELREVAHLEHLKRSEMSAMEETVSGLERAIAQSVDELEQVKARLMAQEKDLLAMDHEGRALAEQSERMGAVLSHARIELEQLSSNRIQLEQVLNRDRETLTSSELASAGQERELESVRKRLSALQAEVARVTEEHATLRANLASLEERNRALADNRARTALQVDDLKRRREQIEHETERLIEERTEYLLTNQQLETKSTELTGSILSAEESVNVLVERDAEVRNRRTAIEEELKRLRTASQIAQEKRSELQVALARTESDLKYLDETSHRELGATLAQLVNEVETIPDAAVLDGIEAKYADAQRKIEALGPVNPEALQEFEEAQQRQEFLNAQRQDLLDSIRDTEHAIHQIDEESRKRFAQAFEAININFREMFANLFAGGVGEMRLTDEDNIAESGIDIVASPPGKKLQSVLLLSGGEKSLTAMALLMAIFQYTPSPFCVLDEVDAPLDEPNIERLTCLLKAMSEHTQFIVITHAKRTMEVAQSLYGVTMQEAGISKLVSVKFDRSGTARQAKERSRTAGRETFSAV